MAKCNFTIPFNDSAEALITKANNAIANAGGQFSGDTSSGKFSLSTFVGLITGNYAIIDNKFEIEITDKPIFVGCKMIEDELKKYL